MDMLFGHFTTIVTTAVLALLTFCLAAIGLYGVLSYSTEMRRLELGTRLALGAKRKSIVLLIIKDNATAIGLGIIISGIILLLGYLGFSQILKPYLQWQLLGSFTLTLLLIGLITLFTCYWPLRPYINRQVIYSLRGSD